LIVIVPFFRTDDIGGGGNLHEGRSLSMSSTSSFASSTMSSVMATVATAAAVAAASPSSSSPPPLNFGEFEFEFPEPWLLTKVDDLAHKKKIRKLLRQGTAATT
jgi:hypothetical protein